MKKQFEPRTCAVCGTVFIPERANVKTCDNPKCKKQRQRQQQRDWYKANYASAQERRRDQAKRIKEENKVDEPHQPKPDTIVAIGYADRQRQETLKMAGRINTKL